MFGARRIKNPKGGPLSMHPFVDVLEGRNYLSGSLHEGVIAVEAIAPVPAMDASGVATAPIQPTEIRATKIRLLPWETVPTMIELPSVGEQGVFSGNRIDGGEQVLFGNPYYDRRGRGAPAVMESSLPADQLADQGPVFSDSRALTGAMRPYLTLNMAGRADAFAQGVLVEGPRTA